MLAKKQYKLRLRWSAHHDNPIKIEAALRESEERYRTLFDRSPDAIFLIEPHEDSTNWKIVDCNTTACEMNGYEREEIIGQCIDMFHQVPCSAEHWMETLRYLRQHKRKFVQTSHCRKDGTKFPIEASLHLITIDGREMLLGIDRDVTERYLAEAARSESEEKYQTLFDRIPDGIVLIDISNDDIWPIVDCNKAFCQMNGYTSEDLIGNDIDMLNNSPSGKKGRLEYLIRLRQERSIREEVTHRRKDGSTYIVETRGNFVIIGTREYLLGIDRDITDRLTIENALRENEIKYRTLFDRSPDAIFLISLRNESSHWPIIDCNEAACRMNGYERSELLGKTIDIIHPEALPLEIKQQSLESLRKNSTQSEEFLHRKKDGTIFPVEVVRSLITLNGEETLLGIDRDITERKQAEEIIRHQAFYDRLTGLPNRTLFSDRISLALSHVRRTDGVLAVIFLDLDRFKLINETLGHDVGDKLLQNVADRLSMCMREGDTVARFGGDEFIILLPEIHRMEDVALFAETILESFKRPFILRDMELFITVSIGIAVYPHDGDDADKLLINADAAQSRAKEHGRNNYQYYTPSMNARASERLVIESSLRRALEREEFILFYQPQILAENGEIIGAEALIRWNHPELGFISPAEFIPLAEEMGLIGPIGEWVLRKACLQNIKWRNLGNQPIRMAVNLSSLQLQDVGLVQRISEILHETGHDPRDLELEITESAAMKNPDFTTKVLEDFKTMGVRVALDDFGTGYSSLAYLKRFPLDILKIDRSFIHDLTVNSNDATIAKTIILLTHSLSLSVVAEGVETLEQVEFLKNNHCDVLQGYFYSRPVPPSQFEELLREHRLSKSSVTKNE